PVTQAHDLPDIGVTLQREADAIEGVGFHHDYRIRAKGFYIAGDFQMDGNLPQGMEQTARPAQFARNLFDAQADGQRKILLPQRIAVYLNIYQDVIGIFESFPPVCGRFDVDVMIDAVYQTPGQPRHDVHMRLVDVHETDGCTVEAGVVNQIAQCLWPESQAGRADNRHYRWFFHRFYTFV